MSAADKLLADLVEAVERGMGVSGSYFGGPALRAAREYLSATRPTNSSPISTELVGGEGRASATPRSIEGTATEDVVNGERDFQFTFYRRTVGFQPGDFRATLIIHDSEVQSGDVVSGSEKV